MFTKTFFCLGSKIVNRNYPNFQNSIYHSKNTFKEIKSVVATNNAHYLHITNNQGNDEIWDCNFTPIFNAQEINTLAAGNYHIVILVDNKLWVQGNNFCGALGLGTYKSAMNFEPAILPTEIGKIKGIAAGDYHTFFWTEDNTLWGCGYNKQYQLGINNGYKFSCGRDLLYFTQIPLPKKIVINKVATAVDHTIIWTDQGLLGSGSNYFGQLGQGYDTCMKKFQEIPFENSDIQGVAAGTYNTLCWTTSEVYRCGVFSENKIVNQFTKIDIPSDLEIKNMAIGWDRPLILDKKNKVWLIEGNKYRQFEEDIKDYQGIAATNRNFFFWTKEELRRCGNEQIPSPP